MPILKTISRIRKSLRIRYHQKLSKYLTQKNGWRSENPILVIESDDWGAEHVPSYDVIKKVLAGGEPSDYDFDGLESSDDIEKLCDILSSCRNLKGNRPVFTANFIMSNPDYLEIKKSDYKSFVYKTISDSFNHEVNSSVLWKSYKQAISRGLFVPQLHGLFHFNVRRWMEKIKNQEPDTMKAFDYMMVGRTEDESGIGISGMAPIYHAEEQEIRKLIEAGTKLFENVFGIKSFTSIAPCYAWASPLTELLFRQFGVNAIQGKEFQYLPNKKIKSHYLGEIGPGGVIYLTRNCVLEPVVGKTTAKECFKQITFAFRNNLPAIICSHRINYTSRVNKEKRELGLKTLHEVLQKVVVCFPNVEFLSSDQLAKKILKLIY